MEVFPVLQRGLYEPVLAGQAEEPSPGKSFSECCRRAARLARLSLSDWWADSTSESYLDTDLSRRTFWHISLATIGAVILVMDMTDGVNVFVCIDVLFLISVVLVTNLMPRQHLKADLALSAVLVLCSSCGLVAIRCGNGYPPDSDASESEMIWAWAANVICLVVMYMGMHSTAATAALVMLMLISTTLAPRAILVFAAGAGLAATTGVMIESLLAAAHNYHAALKTVLDGCSDGIVCVSVSDGTIGSASGKMQDIWGGGTPSGASGVDFKECLHPDDAGQWEALLEEARAGVPKARLVTCQTVLLDAVTTVDCKLVPYMRRQDKLWICCHTVGEARTAFGACHGPLAPVEEEADPDVASAVVRRGEEDPPAEVGKRDQVTLGALAPHGASCPPPPVRSAAAPSLAAGSELTYSITEISIPNPKAKLDASTQTLGSSSQKRTRPPRLPRAPAQAPAAGAAFSTSEVRLEGRQVRVSKSKKKVLPQYAETPPATATLLLVHACCAINARGRGCCPWHVTIGRLQGALEKMRDGACQGSFLPYDDWQCAHCLALNAHTEDADDDEQCGICGFNEAAVEHYDTDSGELGGSEAAHRA